MKSIESNIISRIRWPLMTLVVLIHSEINEVTDYSDGLGGVISAPDVYTLYGFVRYYLCDVVGRVAVPLFFLISGFLFFRWTDEFSYDIYIKKIRSRFRTLLVPFFLWNLLYILAFFVLSRVSNDAALIIYRNNDVIAIIQKLWVDPPCFPFWFLRDLMVMCLLTIVFYPLLHYGRWVVPVLFLLLWLCGILPSVKGFSAQGVTFFLLGAYGGIRKYILPLKLITNTIVKILALIYIILGLVEAYFRNSDITGCIHNFNILVGSMTLVLFAALCTKNEFPTIPQSISSSAFFLFGFHGLFIKMFRNTVIPILKPASNTEFVGILLAIFVVTVVVSVLCYNLAIKILSRTTALFCGGRSS